ncbi:MAG: GNAT family N-acetyltransferase [Ignavibacteria bacterium]|nr:GNAT family N-acetyltransferase [Ignavibacteria bacterium]MCU7502046.1 GNAT family N-acetyltransferase [Ignavibacteria bacterium]MCU7515448.1 GNAT family N-acetyltransferase [Ignavibacteria bacterium]
MIRKLMAEDREKLSEILRGIVQFNAEEVEVAMELIDVAILRPLQEDYLIYVYEQDGNVIGYHCTGRRPLTDGVFDLYWIVVDPSVQSKGIGRQLLNHAEGIVAQNKGRWLLAETSSKDSYLGTRSFYMKNGYSVVAEIRDFYSLKDNLVIFGKYFQ